MFQAVKCNLFLYADGTCLIIHHKDINEIGKQLNQDLEKSVTGLLIKSQVSILAITKLSV